MNTLFKEIQRFNQWWLWGLLVLILCIPVYGIYKQVLMNEPIGSKPISDIGLFIILFIIILIIALIWSMKLETSITSQEIEIKYFPFTHRKISWSDIKTAEVVNYGFVGGWGWRISSQYGIVYNTSGNKGLVIQLKSGNKICIGTQRQKELQNVIESIQENNT